MKILVMDNDKQVADAISCELEEVLVRYAADGEVGLKIAQERRFDLIVIDWALPKKDGLSVLKELRELKVMTPVLMLTAEDFVKAVVISLDSGANDCVTKPFEIHVLMARMKALIRRSKWDSCAEIRHAHIPLAPVISVLDGR